MATSMPTETKEAKSEPLGDPALRKQLEEFVRRRVPAADVDDVVQTVLLDALASKSRPAGGEELKKWVLGIARHKVVDRHRRANREAPAEAPDMEASPAPIEEIELARWAEEQAGSTRDAQRTLEWMAREGEGEKLEAIAAEEKVPAARVRQRVSRMRRWMKERWLAELAAVATFAVLALVLYWVLRKPEEPIVKPEKPAPTATIEAPEAPPNVEARRMRDEALDKCAREDWKGCVDELDRAKALDPAGDTDPRVGAAREKANEMLEAPPIDSTKDAPKSSSTVAPSKPIAPTMRDKELLLKEKMFKELDAAKKKSKAGPKSAPPFDGAKDAPNLDEPKPEAPPLQQTAPNAPPPQQMQAPPQQAPASLDDEQQQAPPVTKSAPKKAPRKK